MSRIIFMGDSITEYMPYIFNGNIGNEGDEVKYFGVENIGVGNYMNYVWPRVEHENADTYILLIGTNNISRPDCDYDDRETLNDLVEKLKEFICKIISNSNLKLLVQSIYPTKYVGEINSIKVVNGKIEEYCNEIGVEYLDLYSLLIDEKELFDTKYSDDGIHPNESGYNIIANEINKKLKKSFSKKLISNKK